MDKLKRYLWDHFEIDLEAEEEEFQYDLACFFNYYSIAEERDSIELFFRFLKSVRNFDDECLNFVLDFFGEEIKFLRNLVNSN